MTDVPLHLRWRLPNWRKLRLSGWQRNVGLGLFGLLCFLLFLPLTFPVESARARLQLDADRAGLVVRMEGLSAGLFSLTARKLRVSRVEDIDPVPVVVDRVTLWPMLFPPGLRVQADLFGGTASASLASSGQWLRVRLRGIDLARSNLKTVTGIDAEGKVDGELTLELPSVRGEQDLSQASGALRVKGSGLLVKGGTITLPLYGGPVPVDLPRAALGALDGEVTFERGAGSVQNMHLAGEDIEAFATGTTKLARRVEYVELALSVRLKPEAEFVRRLGVVGAGVSTLPADAEHPGFRDARVGGFLGKPVFTPGR
jgi:type II secretion system protein N